MVSLLAAPSSHSSPVVLIPLPQSLRQQEQPSSSTLFPSSHSSPLSTIPSPHDGSRQVPARHLFAVRPLLAPSSHCSQFTGSMTPSPHEGSWQFIRHALGRVSLFPSLARAGKTAGCPLSHCSPKAASMIRLPHLQVQLSKQRGLLRKSHCSLGSTIPSPHPALRQPGRHGAPGALLLLAPASHCSAPSITPLPQRRVQLLLQRGPPSQVSFR